MAVYDLAKTKLILDSGANANVETKAKLTPLAIAALLIDKGAKLSAALFGDLDLMRLLLFKGAKVSDSPNLARNAAAGHCLQSLRIALDGGASPNGPANGRSALQDAAAFGQLEMVRLLLEKGADIQAADKRGYTALMRAALSFALRFGDTSIVRMLRNAGAPDAKTASASRLHSPRTPSATLSSERYPCCSESVNPSISSRAAHPATTTHYLRWLFPWRVGVALRLTTLPQPKSTKALRKLAESKA